MGFINRILKTKKSKATEPTKKIPPKADSVSEGGSPIYHYKDDEEKGWRPPQAYGVFAEEITKHFEGLFPDREETVFHEIISDLVHIDVNIRKPNEKSPFYVVYTTGMSDLPMTMPEGYETREDLQYAELFIFLPPTWNPGENLALSSDIPESEYWIIHLIKYLARFPHEYTTWLGYGHTIPNGPDYEPLCADTAMSGVVLVQTDGDLGSMETEDGKTINFYMVVPAYQEEIEYKLKYGMKALDDIFSKENLPMVLDIHRENYCVDFKERLD